MFLLTQLSLIKTTIFKINFGNTSENWVNFHKIIEVIKFYNNNNINFN